MSDAPSGEEAHSPAILIVEDDALLRLTLSDHLQDQGFKVLEASNGDEALAIMAAPAFYVDIVVTDVMMPGITDGFALAKWIAENQPDIPVIVASGDTAKIELAEAEESRFQFLRKPYELDALTVMIRETLSKR